MATLAELCKSYGVDLDGLDKQAQETENKSESKENEDAKKILEELKGETKESEKGGKEKMNLTELYNQMAGEEKEQEKQASYENYDEMEEELDKIAEHEVEKMAAYAEEERTKGRFLAIGFSNELSKLAEMPTDSDAVGETSDTQIPNDYSEGVADMTGLDVQTENDVKDVLVEAEVADLIGKQKGLNPSGQTGQDNKVAADAMVKQAEENVDGLLKTAQYYYNEGSELARQEIAELFKVAEEAGMEAQETEEEGEGENEEEKEKAKKAVKEEMKKNAAYREQLLNEYYRQ